MSPGINYFLLLRDEQNSKCVWGGGGCWWCYTKKRDTVEDGLMECASEGNSGG
jgi:hypothetical protein